MDSDIIEVIFLGMAICIVPLILFFEFYHWVRNQNRVDNPYLKGIFSGFCMGVIFSMLILSSVHGESRLPAFALTPFLVLGFMLAGIIVATFYKWLNRTLFKRKIK